MNRMISIALCAAGTLFAASAGAGDKDDIFDLRAAVGYQHDSNVNVGELDQNTGEADGATRLELDLGARVPFTDALSLKLGYGYAQTAYERFDDYDTAIHRLQGDLSLRAAGFDSGLALRHFSARLANERFLDVRQVSPSIARLLGNKLYLRGAYTAEDKTYAQADTRNANADGVDVDAYVLLDGMRRHLAFGVSSRDEDALDDELDFTGQRVRVAYGHELESLPLSFKARVQYEERDYVNVSESLGTARRDERLRTSITARYAFTEYLSLEGEAQQASTRSNLESAAYDERVYTLSLAAGF